MHKTIVSRYGIKKMLGIKGKTIPGDLIAKYQSRKTPSQPTVSVKNIIKKTI